MHEAGAGCAATVGARVLDELWPALADFSQMAAVGGDEVLLRANARTSDVATHLTAFAAECEQRGIDVRALADVACGVVQLRLRAVPPVLEQQLPNLLRQWRARGAQMMVAAATAATKANLALWGDPPPALRVMQQIKLHFDPHLMLNPGRDLVSASLAPQPVEAANDSSDAQKETRHAN
jgi:hypothetical protein